MENAVAVHLPRPLIERVDQAAAAEFRSRNNYVRVALQRAAQEVLPLREALREVGHARAEFVALRSAMQDLEDAQRDARRRQALRHAGVDPDSGAELDVPKPKVSTFAIERAADDAQAG